MGVVEGFMPFWRKLIFRGKRVGVVVLVPLLVGHMAPILKSGSGRDTSLSLPVGLLWDLVERSWAIIRYDLRYLEEGGQISGNHDNALMIGSKGRAWDGAGGSEAEIGLPPIDPCNLEHIFLFSFFFIVCLHLHVSISSAKQVEESLCKV